MQTRWTVETRRGTDVVKIEVVVDSIDQETINRVEKAALDAGVELIRVAADPQTSTI